MTKDKCKEIVTKVAGVFLNEENGNRVTQFSIIGLVSIINAEIDKELEE